MTKYTFNNLMFNPNDPSKSTVELTLSDSETIVTLTLTKLPIGVTRMSDPPPNAYWYPNDYSSIEVLDYLQWRPFAIPPGMFRFTYYDVGKMVYDNNDTSVLNYYIQDAFVTYLANSANADASLS